MIRVLYTPELWAEKKMDGEKPVGIAVIDVDDLLSYLERIKTQLRMHSLIEVIEDFEEELRYQKSQGDRME